VAFEAWANLRAIRWWPILASWTAALAGLATAFAPVAGEARMAGVLVAIGGVFAISIVHGWKLWRVAHTVKLRTDAAGLMANDKLIAPRERIAAAYYEPASEEDPEPRVTFRMRRQRDFVVVSDPADATRILAELGFDAAHARTDFRAAPLPVSGGGAAMIFFGLVIALLYLFGAVQSPLWPLAFVLLPLAAIPRKIRVGADGVFVSWLGLSRFVSYADIRRVRALPEGVGLELANGATFFVRTAGLRENRDGTVVRGAFLDHPYTIAARIEEAQRAYLLARAADDPAALAPPGDDLKEWVARMRRLGTGDGSAYRAAAVSRETLWRIAENAAAPAAARAGAIIALSPSLDDPERQRLRIAVDAVVDPRAREALTRAAEGEDDSLLESLSALQK
jgi:hypothetical protein